MSREQILQVHTAETIIAYFMNPHRFKLYDYNLAMKLIQEGCIKVTIFSEFGPKHNQRGKRKIKHKKIDNKSNSDKSNRDGWNSDQSNTDDLNIDQSNYNHLTLKEQMKEVLEVTSSDQYNGADEKQNY